ncbi:MAG: PQQ-dependent sugar dehydrogenase, partial [Dehalococcoidia bacterium]|nr:PQQ-dependent sugar dehydrogenase [Dehalococcoidia bacterium]
MKFIVVSLLVPLVIVVGASCGPAERGPEPVATSTNTPQATAPAAKTATTVPVAMPTSAPTSTPTRPPQTATATALPQQAPVTNVEVLVTRLQTPWAIDFAPDGRIFLTERPGRIRVIKNGQLQTEPWLTLNVAETGEAGLLGLALDPQFAQNRFIYVAYTYRTGTGGLQNRLVRLREDPTTGQGAVDKVLLDGVAAGANHNGGRVKFGPDGKLYWTMGETFNRPLAQDLASLNGKILRLNPDGTIPADNP